MSYILYKLYARNLIHYNNTSFLNILTRNSHFIYSHQIYNDDPNKSKLPLQEEKTLKCT